MRSLIAIALLSSALVTLPAHAAVSDAAFLTKAAATKAAANVELKKILTELTKLTPDARQAVLKGMVKQGLPGLGKGNNLLLALTQLMAVQHADDAAAFRNDVLAVLGTGDANKSYVDAINGKFGALVAGKNPTVPTTNGNWVLVNPLLADFAIVGFDTKSLEQAILGLPAGNVASVAKRAEQLGVDPGDAVKNLLAVQPGNVEPAGGEQGNDVDFGFADDADGEDVLENPNNLSPNTPVVTKKTNNS